ncbi:MAG: hypothetical protein A2X50_06800 [Candidatus Rokubacteria bacterium GWF2_70_14]|nr:MAG: hypothetical protein A2X53_17440 [Candidatus Rokubacteria bacterium GWA2_70_23]OGK94832.1 MAG: hypothetical protein A2X50_06800 [Candidatus Rokubacteria bacterium GWF2_70_14]
MARLKIGFIPIEGGHFYREALDPVWIGGWGELTLRRAATLGDNWIPGPTAELPRLIAGKTQFLDNRARAGLTAPIAEWPLTRDVIIAGRRPSGPSCDAASWRAASSSVAGRHPEVPC